MATAVSQLQTDWYGQAFQPFENPVPVALLNLAKAIDAGTGGGVTVASLVFDGVTDNTAILQAALTSAAAGNARTVYIPPSSGSAVFSSKVTIPGGVTIFAYPGTVTLKAKVGNASNPLLLEVTGASNILIYGLTLDGGGTTFASASNANTIFQSTNVVFDHVTVQNTHGIGLIFSTSIVSSGVRASAFNNAGASSVKQGLAFSNGTAANNHDNFAINNSFKITGLDALSITNQHNFVAANNRFLSAGSASIFASGNDALTIVGNSSTSAAGDGIDTASNTDAVITGNTVKFSGGSGIGVAYSTNVTVSGNISCNNNQAAGGNNGALFLSGATTPLANVSVTGNVFSDDQGSPTQPFAIYQQAGGTVTGVYVSKSNIGTGNTSAFFGGTIYSYSDPVQTLYVTGASVGNGADQTEDILQTFTVPANALLNNGDQLHVTAAGTYAASTDTKTARIRFGGIGGTIISSPVGSGVGNVFWSLDAWIVKTATATFTSMALGRVINATNDGTHAATGGLLDLTQTQTMIVTGQNSTASTSGSITCSYFRVDLVKAP